MKNSLKLKIVICGIAALTNIAVTSARCEDTVIMGSNRQTGGEGAGDRAALQEIRARMAALKGH